MFLHNSYRFCIVMWPIFRLQAPTPPPRPLARNCLSKGVDHPGTRDDLPLFEALYVVSVEGGAPAGEGGMEAQPPSSSAEAYQRANRPSAPKIIWRCVLGFHRFDSRLFH